MIVAARFRVRFQVVKAPTSSGLSRGNRTEKAFGPQTSSEGNLFVRARFGVVLSTVQLLWGLSEHNPFLMYLRDQHGNYWLSGARTPS